MGYYNGIDCFFQQHNFVRQLNLPDEPLFLSSYGRFFTSANPAAGFASAAHAALGAIFQFFGGRRSAVLLVQVCLAKARGGCSVGSRASRLARG